MTSGDLECTDGPRRRPRAPAPSRRLRRRLLRRPHRRGRTGGRDADRRRRTGGPDLRDAGRAHARARAARAAARPGRRLRAAARRPAAADPRATACSTASASSATSVPPIRAARRGASRALARELGPARAADRGRRRRRPVAAGSIATRCARALGGAPTALDAASAPTRTMGAERDRRCAARRRRHRRHRPRRRSVADGRSGAGALRLGARRLGPARPRDDGRPPARVRRAGDAAATTPTPATRTCPISRTSAIPIAEIDADGHCVDHQGRRHRRPARRAHGQGAAALRGARSGGLPHARRRRRHQRGATSTQVGTDRVRAARRARPSAARRRSRSTCSSSSGWLGEGEISYAGPGAEARARLAARRDARAPAVGCGRLRVDLIGVTSVLRRRRRRLAGSAPRRRRDRRAPARRRAATPTAPIAERLPREVTALYTCGPAGGGGVRTSLRQRLSTALRAACRASACRRASSSSSEPQRMARPARTVPLYRARARPHRRQGQPLEHQRHRLGSRRSGRCSSSRSPRSASPAQFAHRKPDAGRRATCCRSCTR